MNPVSIFKNEQFGSPRIVSTSAGFSIVAKDVVEGVGNVWEGGKSIRHVPEQWKGVYSVSTPRGTQEMLTLTEQGLYFYLGRCDKPAALNYQMWLADEVLPAIRRDGAYVHAQDTDSEIEILARGMLAANSAIERLEKKLTEAAPKVALTDAYLTEGEEISMGDLAKKLNHEGVEIGQNRLFKFLRDKGVLISRPGVTFNTPTQKYADRGWFKIIQPPESQIGKWKKGIRVTPKGVLEISGRMHELFGSDM